MGVDATVQLLRPVEQTLSEMPTAQHPRNLADALRILTRVLRRRKRLTADPDNEMRIGMIAAASFESLEDWARFTGELITEITSEAEDKDAAKQPLLKLRRLVQLDPALARHCAAADAALAAFAL